ncbi:hypothetical protein MMC13_006892 [Lambiella insularis]|nr:hypothetical protein [Lambiella insularis]
MPPQFASPPPPTSFTTLSFPRPHVLLVTLSRHKSLNCINTAGNAELSAVWTWLDNEPSLRIGLVTGDGRAFCAGADLKGSRSRDGDAVLSHTVEIRLANRHGAHLEWNDANKSRQSRALSENGFGGLSTRSGKKPVIAAVNGICFGGGCEMIVNADIVLASSAAQFGLPEVKRGVVALAGALPRLVRTVGRQRAMEMALTGRTLTAGEAREWGLVNKVVDPAHLMDEAIRWAEEIAGNSPDSVIVSREGIKMGWEGCGVQEGTERLGREWYSKMEGGENMVEGVMAFVEKRRPRWVDSKL